MGNAPSSVAIGDLNGDGRPDLVTADRLDNTVSVLLNTGSGSFAARTSFRTGNAPLSVAIGDLNGDGQPELMTVNGVDKTVFGNGNTGSGSFTAAPTPFGVSSMPLSVAAGDLNGDGLWDLATPDRDNFTVSLLLNTGLTTGRVGFRTYDRYPVDNLSLSVAIGDLNGDGRPDLVTGDGEAVAVLLDNGSGRFADRLVYPIYGLPYSVAIGDLNGDGRPDLVTANTDRNTVVLLLNTGQGRFAAPTGFRVGERPSSVAVGDLNGDGRPDLVVANQDDDTVTVLLTTTPTVTISPASQTITQGQSATLSGGGASYYEWSTGQTANPISVTPTTTTAYSVTGISPTCSAVASATVTVRSALPVRLVYFNGRATASGHQLEWQTSLETSNAGFTLLRGPQPTSLEAIASLPSLAPAGHASSLLSYSYLDAAPPAGLSYYQLRQTDFDGSQHLSALIAIRGEGPLAGGVLFPNPAPASGQLSLEPAQSYERYELLDSSGKVLVSVGQPGRLAQFGLPANLAAGHYLLRLYGRGSSVQHYRIIR
ncbi:T9SS type A sorting domain-containing protein [Spirosoma validum]|uniref:T9SS type A sorting domain-containing protein n=1 Tax=Spirosoma validum TaxID=2771355 RepID=A0A927B9N2_9BACT|nr:T9SS type A sorting domain-containing protein [Spirosoma validum]MBD2757742.1 T9SS type A sorting domain-containing protein [Spirosoma validum]